MKVFFVEIDPDADDITGVDAIGLVDVPAHLRNFVTFNETAAPKEEDIFEQKFEFDDDEQIVRGVMIAANMMIKRFHPEMGGEHYVIFQPEVIDQIRHKYHKLGHQNNVNLHHDPDDTVQQIYMFESYVIDRESGVNPPEWLKGQRVDDGSWVGSYKIEDSETWNRIKSGEVAGISVEGWFGHREANVTRSEMSSTLTKQQREQLFLLSRTVENLK